MKEIMKVNEIINKTIKFISVYCNRASDNFCDVCKISIPNRRIDKHFVNIELLFKSRDIFAGATARAPSI